MNPFPHVWALKYFTWDALWDLIGDVLDGIDPMLRLNHKIKRMLHDPWCPDWAIVRVVTRNLDGLCASAPHLHDVFSCLEKHASDRPGVAQFLRENVTRIEDVGLVAVAADDE